METLLAQLIDKYDYMRRSYGYLSATASKLGFEIEVKHLQDLRQAVEDFGFDLKSISEKYDKEKVDNKAEKSITQ
jgi:hypothetical protein